MGGLNPTLLYVSFAFGCMPVINICSWQLRTLADCPEGVGTDYISSYRDDRVHENDPEAAHPGSPGTYRDEENETETPDITHDEEANGSQIQAATSRAVNSNERQRRNVKITLAAFYAVQVFYSFFIM